MIEVGIVFQLHFKQQCLQYLNLDHLDLRVYDQVESGISLEYTIFLVALAINETWIMSCQWQQLFEVFEIQRKKVRQVFYLFALKYKFFLIFASNSDTNIKQDRKSLDIPINIIHNQHFIFTFSLRFLQELYQLFLIDQTFLIYFMSSENIVLISNRLCPFAERAVIAARQKKIDFTLKEVSLMNKQPYFTQSYRNAYGHNPKSDGKVPIFIHGKISLAQSELISWYIAQTFSTGTQLIPDNTFQRFKIRYFCQNVPIKIIKAFYSFIGFTKKSVSEQQRTINNALKAIQFVNSKIEGPYVFGDKFSLADVMIYPWFERWIVIQSLFNVKIDQKYEKIINFVKNMQKRQSVIQSMLTMEDFVRLNPFYKWYFKVETANL